MFFGICFAFKGDSIISHPPVFKELHNPLKAIPEIKEYPKHFDLLPPVYRLMVNGIDCLSFLAGVNPEGP